MTRRLSTLLWDAYGWMATRANCCVVGCSCVTLPLLLMGGATGLAALIHFT